MVKDINNNKSLRWAPICFSYFIYVCKHQVFPMYFRDKGPNLKEFPFLLFDNNNNSGQ